MFASGQVPFRGDSERKQQVESWFKAGILDAAAGIGVGVGAVEGVGGGGGGGGGGGASRNLVVGVVAASRRG